MGTSIIIVSVAFAFFRLLNTPIVNAVLTQSLSELVEVIIQVLFLAVMIWGGSILLDRGLRKS